MGAREKAEEISEILRQIEALEGLLIEKICDARFANKFDALEKRLDQHELFAIADRTGWLIGLRAKFRALGFPRNVRWHL